MKMTFERGQSLYESKGTVPFMADGLGLNTNDLTHQQNRPLCPYL